MPNAPKVNRPAKAKAGEVIPPLPLEDRKKLAGFLNDPVMQKALRRVGMVKPGVFFAGAGTGAAALKDTASAMLASNNRLHEIRGWELFEAALFGEAEDPKAIRVPINETYPDEQ